MSSTDPFAAPSRMYPSKKKNKQEEVVAATAEEAADEVPTGTITEIKEWVGDDTDRAQAALDAERKSDHARVTLIEYLEDEVSG